MIFKIFKIFIVLSFVVSLQIAAQGKGDATLRKIGFHTGNRVGISFYNDGAITGFRQGVDIRGEWPLGSGENYIGDVTPLIGVEFTNTNGKTLQSVTISRGPRYRQGNERHPTAGYFWGWDPIPGFLNPNGESVAMSHLQDSWPIGGWADPGGFPDVVNYVDADGNTEWWGYFGRGLMQADQESYFIADDQNDDEFNGVNEANEATLWIPDSTDLLRQGMGLQYIQRGFQWASFLAEDVVFWLMDIRNEGTENYRRADFGTVVGTLAGGDGDSGDDLGFFDTKRSITYSWDSDGIGNKGQKVGYVGYAYLESPGNPFDGIDNDGDSKDPSSPMFSFPDFLERNLSAGDKVVLIEKDTYKRTIYTLGSLPDTVYSLGEMTVVEDGVPLREGHIGKVINGVAIPDSTAYDGIDNDLDGLIDENESLHISSREVNNQEPVKYINFLTGEGVNDLLIDERRDNDIDEDGDWAPDSDDLGQDGLGPDDENYPGPDAGEGDGVPTQGEPNFGRTDPDESDQIGLTAFNFFGIAASPDMSNDSLLWARMTPGRFDEIPPIPQDGDFIYASGYFPLMSQTIERFSEALLFGEDLKDIQSNQKIVQQIYNSGYKFPQPPRKPKITITQADGDVVLYWDNGPTERSKDFITKKKDFQGYKIYRTTDAGFRDARSITNAFGVLSFDKPIAQYDIADSISGFYYPSASMLEQVGGTTYYLGDNTGIINRFIDSTVTPGITYYYAVCAYDSGEEDLEIFPSENSKFIFREASGNIITDDNTGYITPGRRPTGYDKADLLSFDKNDTYKATGEIVVEMIDDAAINNNYSYQLTFRDTALQGYTQDYTLIDLQTPDTVYIPLSNNTEIVNPGDSIQVPTGTDTVYVNGKLVEVNSDYYVAPYDTLINRDTTFIGNTDIVQGFRLQIYNDWEIKLDTSYSGFIDIPDTSNANYTFEVFTNGSWPKDNGIAFPNDYEIQFFDSNVGMSVPDSIGLAGLTRIPATETNIKVLSKTTGKEVDYVYLSGGSLTTFYNIWFKEHIGGSYVRTWKVVINYLEPDIPLETKGKLMLTTTKPFSRADVVTFKVKGPSMDESGNATNLDLIKVVPNPYVVTHRGEAALLSSQTSGRGEREIRFTRVPPGSKISIFTVRGDKIRTLTQDELFVGNVYWNLRTEENLDAAYGVYIFVVETENGEKKIGKFALLK
ncbi:MAG: hypothetical protein L3J41_14330 [Melioribacteraceae bacterium]|nr:hypothetical protein [Melioribacteraceae bacterium]